MNRPTPEQIAEARAWFDQKILDALVFEGRSSTARHIRTLLAATEEPTIEAVAVKAVKFADERICDGLDPARSKDIEKAARTYRERDYEDLSPWGAFVQGFITARKEQKR